MMVGSDDPSSYWVLVSIFRGELLKFRVGIRFLLTIHFQMLISGRDVFCCEIFFLGGEKM